LCIEVLADDPENFRLQQKGEPCRTVRSCNRGLTTTGKGGKPRGQTDKKKVGKVHGKRCWRVAGNAWVLVRKKEMRINPAESVKKKDVAAG